MKKESNLVASYSQRKSRFSGVILGVDPSLRSTGLALVQYEKGEPCKLIRSTAITLGARYGFTECLGEIALVVESWIKESRIDQVAIEETIYVQNFQTAQKLGAVRGAIVGTISKNGLPVSEYPPLRIKQAVVGYGRASKEQVSRMVANMFKLPQPLGFDESDALAVAICHAMSVK